MVGRGVNFIRLEHVMPITQTGVFVKPEPFKWRYFLGVIYY